MEEQEDFLPETSIESIPEIPDKQIYRPHNYGMNHLTQFGLLLGLIGMGLVVGSVATILLVKLMMPGVSIFEMDKAIVNPLYANASRAIQITSTLVMFFLPAYFFAYFVYDKKSFAYLGFNKTISWQQLGLVFLIGWMAIYVGSALGDLNEQIPISKYWQNYFRKAEDSYNEQVLAIAKMNNFKEYLIALVVIALAPAIVEEAFFRGALQQLLISWFRNYWVAIIVTSIIFSAIHFSYYGFLTRASLGIVLGLLFYYSKNIWLNIFAHFLNNAIAVTSLYVFSLQGKPAKDALDDHFPLWWGLAGIFFLVILIIQFKKTSDELLTEKELLHN